MFDFVRRHNRVMQFLLFLLIVPSFLLFGVEGYNRMQEKGPSVAKVDGHAITQADWDAEHRREVDRLRQQMPTLDIKLLDSPEARYGTLERMVRDRVLAAAAAKSRLTASDQRLARELQSNEVIASLRGPDGRLDMDRYKQLVGAQGMTPQMFEEQVRHDIATRQVLLGLAGTSFAPPEQAGVALGAFFGRREIQVGRFDAADYAAQVNPTDAELEAFYKDNAQLFQAPEQASIEYVVLDLDTVRKTLSLNEQDLQTYYKENAARLAGQEERRTSHILLSVPKDAPAAEKDKAKARAQELLEAVRKAPQSFGDLARKNSQDTVSAANGGDLDWSARGGYASKALEDAVFGLKKGESAVVETEYGWHVVMVTDVRAPQQRSFEQMRPELEAEVRKQQAQRKFAESADAFSNAVYEAADGYKSVAERFKVDVRTAQNVTRTPAPGAAGVLANPKFLSVLFSPDSIEKKRNTEAVEVAPGQLVSGRVVQYSPSRTRAFAEVKDDVRQRVAAQRAADLAKKDGEAKLAAWKANPAAAVLSPKVVVSREDPARQPQPVVEAALRTDASALPAFTGVDMGLGGYAIVKVNQALPRQAADPAQAKQDLMQYTRAWSGAEAQAYYAVLKDRFKAQILVAKPAASSEQR
ncbi:MAG TPA: SurA N-terminal domain-containing protein [Ramlibacter sp.]|jgi:peptidyl-prolyl cis-trans isomerase D|uniref:SurA N-terminal domain-containing protein n=1 Tax=Ramlibacter sp. TaxID=1917967 RepID=UPI002D434A4A|nr:SurA N-terminal domain-containing protein [Ramlibacter sp.]HZY19411.1 SurA N-terminal domain-containing protein [Ramlibacter sp.]